MKRKLRLATGSLFLLVAGVSYGQTYQSLTVASGYNEDVIANGVGDASSSTTSDIDNSGYAFLSADFRATASSAAPARSLPANGIITSEANANVVFNFAPYSDDNALKLVTAAATGTLTFTEQVSATNLYFIATSGSGDSDLDITVNFTDGTSQTNTELFIPDWYGGTAIPTAKAGVGRVSRFDNGMQGNAADPRMYQLTISIDIANQNKVIESVTVTKNTVSGALNIFGVSAKLVSDCPEMASASGASSTFTTGAVSWALASAGSSADITYTVEVATDADFTTPIEGSPFTNVTGTTQALTGLTIDTTYYFRVKANNGVCDSAPVTGSFLHGYCTPTINYPYDDYITNVVTTGGYTNINNSTDSDSGYENYTAMAVSKAAGSSFDISVTRYAGYDSVGVYIDWNNNLSFDDEGETLVNIEGSWSGDATYTGSIAIPANTPTGSYRMRVRSAYYYNNTMSPCNDFSYGETEDYTLNVAEQPANCDVPATPAIAAGNITSSGITVTVTGAAAAPTGYILVRSTAALTAGPVLATNYPVGATLGGGRVVAAGLTAPVFTDFVSDNTQYYYTAFAYNDGGIECFGPVYSEPVTINATTCALATVNSGASNIGNFGATLNWTSVSGAGGAATLYTAEVYTDAELTTPAGTYTSDTNSYVLTELEIGTTYFYRVKALTGTCNNDTWSETLSFSTQSMYTPLTVTGYNADVIANGNGIANTSTTHGVDGANNAYMALNYKNSATNPVTTIGLPVNRRLPGTGGPDFILADYSGNNSLRLAAQGQEGTLTLTSPVKAANLYFAVTSGSGDSTIDITVNFADGTTQIASSVAVSDWYNAGTDTQPALVSNIGRTNRADNVGGIESGNAKVFYITLPIDIESQFKTINSVTISKSSDGATEPVPNIFAVAAQLVNECPVLNSAFTFAAETTANVSFGLLAGSAEANSYSYELYTDEAMTVPVEGSPFTTTSTSISLTGLTAETTYYYSATATNDSCTSATVNGSFTTNPTSGTDSFGKNGFVVFPNPANTVLNVKAGESISQLTLVNLLGQTVLKQTATGNQAQLNLASIAAGTYILQVTSGEKTSAVKVIKQ
ncbi:MAG: GEVED domain-containing protein [Bacteroidia bacterium]